MDYKFSGVGTIPTGEYENISVSGSSRLSGDIRCHSFHTSGALGGKCNIVCSGEFHSSGSTGLDGSITADSLAANGSFKSGSISAGRLKINGSCHVDGDIEADSVVIRGELSCSGLVNADTVEILVRGSSRVGSIGGGEILVSTDAENSKKSIFSRRNGHMLEVEESIEADNIRLENAVCPVVTGRCVIIGEGCSIKHVHYSDSVEISPSAKVGSCTRLSAGGEEN